MTNLLAYIKPALSPASLGKDDSTINPSEVLIEPAWLKNNLDNPSIKIIEVDEDPSLYNKSHIPGAIGFDWKEDLQDKTCRDFLSKDDFSKLMASSGINNSDTIILYGDRNNWFAAYTYWYFKYYGHQNVKLLNGGRDFWINSGMPTDDKIPSYPQGDFSVQWVDEAIRAHREDVKEAMGEAFLIDVRSPEEYSGEILAMAGYEQEGAQRGGHIPGAISIPWSSAVADDGRFKSLEELKELYSSKGIELNSDNQMIAYCRIGERSAHTWFVLHELLGQEEVQNYDGSWSEWGNSVGYPVETGFKK